MPITSAYVNLFSHLIKDVFTLKMAESEGFEPSIELPLYTLSRGAPSATRPALQLGRILAKNSAR